MYVWNISIIYNIFYLSIWFFALIDIILIVKKSVLNETNKSEKPFEIIQCRQKIVFVTWPIEEIMLLCGLSKAPQMIFNIFILSRRLHLIDYGMRMCVWERGERERERNSERDWYKAKELDTRYYLKNYDSLCILYHYKDFIVIEILRSL